MMSPNHKSHFALYRHQYALAVQLLAIVSYLLISFFLFEFPRRLPDLVLILAVAAMTELLFSTFVDYRPRIGISPLIAGSAVFILLQSRENALYLWATFFAIASKYLIRVKGRHCYNPANFGVFSVLILFDGDVAIIPGQWGIDTKTLAVVVALGTLVTLLSKRILVTASYLVTFTFWGLLLATIRNDPVLLYLGTALGMPGLIFSFHMITDPKTGPQSKKGMLFFGAAIATADITLRSLSIINAQIYSLFLICSLVPILDTILSPTTFSEGLEQHR